MVFIFDNTGAYTGSVPFEDRAAVLGIAAAEGEAVLLLKSGNGFSRASRASRRRTRSGSWRRGRSRVRSSQ